jgi:hypothetical protein
MSPNGRGGDEGGGRRPDDETPTTVFGRSGDVPPDENPTTVWSTGAQGQTPEPPRYRHADADETRVIPPTGPGHGQGQQPDGQYGQYASTTSTTSRRRRRGTRRPVTSSSTVSRSSAQTRGPDRAAGRNVAGRWP